jgi:hypothetical protein
MKKLFYIKHITELSACYFSEEQNRDHQMHVIWFQKAYHVWEQTLAGGVDSVTRGCLPI